MSSLIIMVAVLLMFVFSVVILPQMTIILSTVSRRDLQGVAAGGGRSQRKRPFMLPISPRTGRVLVSVFPGSGQ